MDLPENAVLDAYRGQFIFDKEEIEDAKARGCLIKTSSGEFIDGSNQGNWTRYIQDYREVIFDEKGEVLGMYETEFQYRLSVKFLPMKLMLPRVVTTRRVMNGEEIFGDYGIDYWKHSRVHKKYLLRKSKCK